MTSPAHLILIGRVAGAHGVKGEVRITAYGDDPMAMVGYRDLKREDGSPALSLISGRAAKGGLIAQAREIASKEAADAMRGLRLHVERARLPEPEEDEYYLADLIGLEARTPDGAVVGRVKALHDFGAGDLLEIAPPQGPTWLCPFTREAVPEVRIGEGWLAVVPPEQEAETSDGKA